MAVTKQGEKYWRKRRSPSGYGIQCVLVCAYGSIPWLCRVSLKGDPLP